MVVIVVPDEVADNVATMKPVIHRMRIGYCTSASNEHQSLHRATPKEYAIVFNIFTPRLVTKLEGAN